MKILVVDDEKLARERVIKLLNSISSKYQIATATTGSEALKLLNKESFDLLLLDIQMTDTNGFEVLMELKKENRPPVIFITAYDEFAIKAFEVNAIDFLLKPFKDDRFFESIQRVTKDDNSKVDILLEQIKNHIPQNTGSTRGLNNIVIKKGNNFYFIATKDVKYIISSAYYAEIFTIDNKKHIYRISMTDFIKVLGENFIRVNRSCILKIEFIKTVVSEGMGDYSIVMNDDEVFSLSKKYRNDFLTVMNIKK